MAATGGGPDFITVDGGEGGTGAAPLAFSDHVALPFKLALRARLPDASRAPGSPRTSSSSAPAGSASPTRRCTRFALGCDMINVGREAMLAIGCIQAQRCHTGRCPTGVATHNRWLMRGLDPELKYARAANYIVALRAELLSLARACGVRHPALIDPDRIEIVSRAATAPRRCARSSGTSREWPLVSRRPPQAKLEALVGRPRPLPAPGPEAGEHAGFPGAGDPSRRHMDARGLGETASEAG